MGPAIPLNIGPVVKTIEPGWMALANYLVTGAVLPPAQVLFSIPVMLGVALVFAGKMLFSWAEDLTDDALASTLFVVGLGIFSKQLMSGRMRNARPCARPSSSSAGEVISPPLPSWGSAAHDVGKCTPCRFHYAGRECKMGYDCQFCHMHTTEKHIRKHKLSAKRVQYWEAYMAASQLQHSCSTSSSSQVNSLHIEPSLSNSGQRNQRPFNSM